MTKNNVLPWEEENWLNEVKEWLDTELSKHGLKITGSLDPFHRRPWSTVLRVPTDLGVYYFKALCPILRHEPELTQALSRWQPDCIAPVVSIDQTRGWMLMPEGGRTLRAVFEHDHDLNYWKKILPIYADLQISLIPQTQKLLDLGVTDRKLNGMPALFSKLLEDKDSLLIDQPEGLTTFEYQRLQLLLPVFTQMCVDLDRIGIPATLQHDDFHDGNIFYNSGNFKFFDWAESFVAHPFFTMVVTLRSIAYGFELDEKSNEMIELRDHYLEPWLKFASRVDLLEAFRLAMMIGKINRALTWNMVVSTLPEQYRIEEAASVPGWLQLFLESIPEAG